jgi:hypothetical protein
MNLRYLGYLLGLLQIIVAIWIFDLSNWNKIIIAILLFLGGVNSFLENPQSQYLVKIKWLIYIMIFIAMVIFVFRMILVK